MIAEDAKGRPKFELALVKRPDDVSANGQYTVLDLALAGDFPVDEALTAARTEAADATVKPIVINRGFARLCSSNDTVTLPVDMTTPVTLGWSGPDFARWTTRLSIDTGNLIKGALTGSTFLFSARVEFDVIGVSPRLPIIVEFEPVTLVEAILAGKSNRQIAAPDLITTFATSRGGIPLRINGTSSGPGAGHFPQAMVDRLVATTVSRSSPGRGVLSGSDGGICVCSGAATAPQTE